MSKIFIIALAVSAILQLAGSGGTIAASGPTTGIDSCGHLTQAEHANNCENARWVCVDNLGPAASRRHDATHCKINYSQCMNR